MRWLLAGSRDVALVRVGGWWVGGWGGGGWKFTNGTGRVACPVFFGSAAANDGAKMDDRDDAFEVGVGPRRSADDDGVERPSADDDGVFDVAVIGAGAAGLMSGIFVGRAAMPGGGGDGVYRKSRVVALDGAKSLGAKILVAGGGRCNVTHHRVEARQYAGSPAASINRVLSRFGVEDTVAFFADLGVTLKREETGKLFPTTDKARTVLDALLRAAREAGVELRYPWRVATVERVLADVHCGGGGGGDGDSGVFVVHREAGSGAGVEEGVGGERFLRARRVILATGGRSLPRSGSDGVGHEIARSFGHTITSPVTPALVPLLLAEHAPRGSDSPYADLRGLSGLSTLATLEVRLSSGKKIKSLTGSTLFTHFGLSGPCPMDISRYWTHARLQDPGTQLVANWLPGLSVEAVDAELLSLGARSVGRYVRERVHDGGVWMPSRLAELILFAAGVDPMTPGHALRREERRGLAVALCAMALPVTGDRGWNAAEVTAGGVPLDEVHLKTMQSKIVPGLYFAGEILDVDGRIGGYNFQWAWASGFVAGGAAGRTP